MMTAEIPEQLLQDIAQFLGRQQVAAGEVVELLVSYQRENHPDRFHEDDAKRSANQRFLDAGTLLLRVKQCVDGGAAPGTSTAIQAVPTSGIELMRSQLEVSSLLAKSMELSEQIDSLRREVETLRDENGELKQQLRQKLDAKLEQARADVSKPYRVTAKTFTAVGITGGCVALYALLSQVEVIFGKVLSPLGLANDITRWSLFLLFCVTLLVAAHRYAKMHSVAAVARGLVTTLSLKRFVASVDKRQDPKEHVEFTESQVVEFINSELRSRRPIDILLRGAGIRALSVHTVEDLKDYALVHMMNAGLVEVGPSDMMERVFRIKKRPSYSPWTDFSKLIEQATAGMY